jgi:predicted nucleic acid-binding protein
MAAVLLDTTILIDVLRGRPEALRRVRGLRAAGDTVHTSAINVEETVSGLRPAEHDAAAQLVGALRVLPIRESEGWQAGEWRREFATRGVTLAQADCLVAATALAAGARLGTGNPKDFPFEELEVEHWPVGA